VSTLNKVFVLNEGPQPQRSNKAERATSLLRRYIDMAEKEYAAGNKDKAASLVNQVATEVDVLLSGFAQEYLR
jgi:hypothetical protein